MCPGGSEAPRGSIFDTVGSPGSNKGRTFRAEFGWLVYRAQAPRPKAKKTYRNPVALALEWRMALDTGRYSSRADLARRKEVSRARVTQILNPLRLAPEVIEIVMDLGDPLPAPMVTERQLRSLISLPTQNQLEQIMIILGAVRSGEKVTHHS